MTAVRRTFSEGAAGEAFVTAHMEQLLSRSLLLNPTVTAATHVAGTDMAALDARLGEPVDDLLPDYAQEPGTIGQPMYPIVHQEVGHIEIKTVWNYLTRNNDGMTPDGSLGFELWEDRSRRKPGFLLKYLHTGTPGEHTVLPSRLVFLLAAYERPFACLAFENVPELLNRLTALAGEYGFDLGTVPMDAEAAAWVAPGACIVENMWQVPLEKIIGCATVTMIGEQPRIRRNNPHGVPGKERMQMERYAFLTQHATLPSVELTDYHCLPVSGTEKIYAILDEDIRVIQNADPEQYPNLILRNQEYYGVIRHLIGLMEYMLSFDSPTKLRGVPAFFPVTIEGLKNWCQDRIDAITGSTQTWQGHLMYLTACGLVKQFRQQTPGQARRGITLRSVPAYTPELLAQAEAIAARFTAAQIKLTRFSKKDAIAVLGQKQADKLYLDKREVPTAYKATCDMLAKIITQQIRRKGYTFPREVFGILKRRIWKEKGFRLEIDPNDDSPETQRELVAQRDSMLVILQARERLRAICTACGCEYRPIRREDREKLHLDKDDRSWIIIPTKAG